MNYKLFTGVDKKEDKKKFVTYRIIVLQFERDMSGIP